MFRNNWLLMRSIVATLLVPGTVAVYLPYLVVRPVVLPPVSTWEWSHVGAASTTALGLWILFMCIRRFAQSGRGTLVKTRLPVIHGLYRYVRNPMYIGVLLILLGESWFLQSGALIRYTGLWFLLINIVVLLYEEPSLRSKYGTDYERYTKVVHRWVPGRSEMSETWGRR